jgi:hypothetical protein
MFGEIAGRPLGGRLAEEALGHRSRHGHLGVAYRLVALCDERVVASCQALHFDCRCRRSTTRLERLDG